MIRRHVTGAIAALSVTLVTAASSRFNPVAADSALFSDAAAESWVECAVNCQGAGDEVGEHVAPLPVGVPPTHERAGGSHDEPFEGACTGWYCETVVCDPFPTNCVCETGWISPRHPECGGSLAAAEEVRNLIRSHDMDQLRKLVRESNVVELVPERMAIQVIGCSGEVMVHIGLAAKAFEQLTT